jgi:oligosaccharide repeat unit polymerase
MTVLFTLLAVLVVAAASWFRSGHWTFPPVILGAAWGFALLCYELSGDALHPLRAATALMITVGVSCFAAGSLVPLAATPTLKHQRHDGVLARNERRASGNWLIVIAALGLPAYIWRLAEVASSGPTESVLMNARLVFSEETVSKAMGPLMYLVPLAIFGAGAHVLGLVKSTRFKSAVMVATALAYAFLSTGRTNVLFVLTLVGGGAAILGLVRPLTLIALAGTTFITTFGVTAFLLKKGVTGGSGIGHQVGSAFTQYVLAGTAGLNDYLAEGMRPLLWGENAFRFVFALLNRLGFDAEPRPLVMEFRSVPFPTNVYTVYRPYYEDFAWAGVAFSQWCLGAFHSATWLRARAGHRSHAFLYGALLYPLLMQLFADQYLSLASLWVQAFLFLAMIRPWRFPRLRAGCARGA